MKQCDYRLAIELLLLLTVVAVLPGCMVGYPARSKVETVELVSRIGTSSNVLETIIARHTEHRCTMLLTPDGLFENWILSVSTDYYLCRADRSLIRLSFLHGRGWMKILPVPSANLWVAISQSKRRGKRDDIEIVVFQEDKLVRTRPLKTLALAEDGHYIGFLVFSGARWMIWYPTKRGPAQYDILRDVYISPLEEWREGEGEILMGKVRP